GSLVTQVALPADEVVDAMFSADSEVLIVGLKSGKLLSWRQADGRTATVPGPIGHAVRRFHTSPDLKRLAVVHEGGIVTLWSTSPAEFVTTLKLPDALAIYLDEPGALAWRQDSARLAVTAKNAIAIFDATTAARLVDCETTQETGRHFLSFSPDGKWLML